MSRSRPIDLPADFLNEMADAVLVRSGSSKVFFANQSFLDMFGYTMDEALAHPTSRFFHGPLETAKTQKGRRLECVGKTSNGSEFPIEISLSPWKGKNGQFSVLVVRKSSPTEAVEDLQKVNHDLSARVQELTEQQKKFIQMAKMSALGEMAVGIAHEINTPLSVISLKGYELEALAKKQPTLKTQILPIAERLRSTARKIAEIIQGLKAFARDTPNAPAEQVEVQTLISDTLGLCEARLKKQGIKVEIAPVPKDLVVRCRPIQIVQVILNLLNNAFDAVASVDIKWVKIQTGRRGNNVCIHVLDSGLGVPEELRAKLMQPFFTTKEFNRGTGLGLSISKGIMDSHGGTLHFDTSREHTCFSVELPVE
jgi:PAS domain S-box-containing protein